MRPEPRAAIFDARSAADRSAPAAQGLTYERFTDGWVLVSAVERQFAIIGESLMRVRDADRHVFDRVPDAAKIVGLRNLIVHGYDAVDPRVLWSIIEEKLPELRRALASLEESGE